VAAAQVPGPQLLVPLDCSSAEEVSFPSFGDTVLAGVTATASQTASYSCRDWVEGGGEYFLKVILGQDMILHARLTSPLDLDLFLLADCNSDACLAGSNSEMMIRLGAGEYFLVVDSNVEGANTFTLDLETLGTGVPAEAQAAAKRISLQEAGPPILGNVFQQEPFITYASCNPYLEFGGERWHRFTLPADASLSASLVLTYENGSLWLFQGLGAEAVCVAYADGALTGEEEVLEYRNDSGEQGTYYLGVDTREEVGWESTGEFTLSVDCDFPDELTGIPLEVAEAASYFICAGDWETVIEGDLLAQPNLVTSAPCGGFREEGGECWYAFILPDEAVLTATLGNLQFDGALWLFDGCGPDAECLAFADARYGADNSLDHTEELVVVKEVGTGHTFYLAVDSHQETGDPLEDWQFQLTVSVSAD